ncbi:MAG: acylphosphatase [Candidatus Woesearchaeota archaeon]
MYKKIIISGKVQNVGFREFLRREASKIGGLVGYVKNLKDGRVEVLVSGEPAKLKEFEKICRKGPLLASIKEISIDDVEYDEEYDSFVIRY